MSRQFKRDMERQRDDQSESAGEVGASPAASERTGAGQFLREVRGELKRVIWPSRKEVTSYSLVVLVAVSIVTLFIFGLDQGFASVVFEIFG